MRALSAALALAFIPALALAGENEWRRYAIPSTGTNVEMPVTITSGFANYNLLFFVLLSIVARGGRFFFVAVLLNRYGTWIREAIEKRLGLWVAIGTGALLLGFIIAFRQEKPYRLEQPEGPG